LQRSFLKVFRSDSNVTVLDFAPKNSNPLRSVDPDFDRPASGPDDLDYNLVADLHEFILSP